MSQPVSASTSYSKAIKKYPRVHLEAATPQREKFTSQAAYNDAYLGHLKAQLEVQQENLANSKRRYEYTVQQLKEGEELKDMVQLHRTSSQEMLESYTATPKRPRGRPPGSGKRRNSKKKADLPIAGSPTVSRAGHFFATNLAPEPVRFDPEPIPPSQQPISIDSNNSDEDLFDAEVPLINRRAQQKNINSNIAEPWPAPPALSREGTIPNIPLIPVKSEPNLQRKVSYDFWLKVLPLHMRGYADEFAAHGLNEADLDGIDNIVLWEMTHDLRLYLGLKAAVASYKECVAETNKPTLLDKTSPGHTPVINYTS